MIFTVDLNADLIVSLEAPQENVFRGSSHPLFVHQSFIRVKWVFQSIMSGSQVNPFLQQIWSIGYYINGLKIKANGTCKQGNISMTSITTECNERTGYHLLIIDSHEPPRRLLITKYAIKILTCNALCSLTGCWELVSCKWSLLSDLLWNSLGLQTAFCWIIWRAEILHNQELPERLLNLSMCMRIKDLYECWHTSQMWFSQQVLIQMWLFHDGHICQHQSLIYYKVGF